MLSTHTARTMPAVRWPAVPPTRLAAMVSLVAAALAVVLHTVTGVAEEPLVVGTLVVASIAGWVNAERQARA